MSRPEAEWTVRAGDPQRLRVFLQQRGIGEIEKLLGRVFVDAHRCLSGDVVVTPGQRILLYSARASTELPVLLLRQGDFLFVDKPPSIPTEPDRRGVTDCVLARIQSLLGVSELHALNRLDLGVSGVVWLARGVAACTFGRELLRARAVRKRYFAIAQGEPPAAQGTWSDPVSRQGRFARSSAGAKPALSRFACVRTLSAAGAPPICLLALEPVSGRMHQLRVHAANHGLPLLGDPKYGGARRLTLSGGQVLELERIALHAAWLYCDGPLEQQKFFARAPVPPALSECWQALGGSAEDLARAIDNQLSLD